MLPILVIAGCGSVQERGDRLARELPVRFPDQISVVTFENVPHVETPTLFIGTELALSSEVARHFLCTEIKPIIEAAGGGIDAVIEYGWIISRDCP